MAALRVGLRRGGLGAVGGGRAIVVGADAGGAARGRLWGGGVLAGLGELNVEGVDGAEGPGVRVPMEVAEGQPRDEAGADELVDVVRVEALDWGG